MKKHDEWATLRHLNVPLFYDSYTDSITLENIYQAFKAQLQRESKKKKK